MAEQKPAQPQAKKEPEPARPAAPAVLGSAAASTNPLVQELLAHREIAILNGDEKAIAAVDAKLAELGVE